MTDHYPHPDGDFTVLGPGVFVSRDGKTISWRGESYIRQEAAEGSACICGGRFPVHHLHSDVHEPVESSPARTTPDNPPTSGDVPGNPLRQRLAAAIYQQNNPGRRWADAHPDDLIAYGGDADAALDALRPELARLTALRQVARDYCFTCGRGDAAPTVADWETQYDRADRAEQQLGKVRDLRDDLRGVTGARWIADALDRILDQPQEQPAARHDDGPSVAECAEADRRYWDIEKGGE